MCGRFSLHVNRQQIRDLPGYDGVDINEWENEEEFVPRYNIAPRTQAPVIRRRDPGSASSSANNDALMLQTMKWGLVPHWSKFEDKTLNTTNARAENLVEGGGIWASIKGKKRCAIPCQGYYEWLNKGKDKVPYLIKRKDDELLLMAGLYDSVVLEGRTLWSFAIVTTDANKQFSWLHDRQPVFLTSGAALKKWLDTTSQTWTTELTKMVQPYHDPLVGLDCYQVPKEVGKVGTESASFIEPVASRKDGIQAMFAKQKQSQADSSPSRVDALAHKKRSRSPSMTKGEPELNQPAEKRKKVDGDKDFYGSISSPRKKGFSEDLKELQRSPGKSVQSPPKKLHNSTAGSAKITSFFRRT